MTHIKIKIYSHTYSFRGHILLSVDYNIIPICIMYRIIHLLENEFTYQLQIKYAVVKMQNIYDIKCIHFKFILNTDNLIWLFRRNSANGIDKM